MIAYPWSNYQSLYRLSLEVLTVMVVGAGRGPLVRAALTAAKTAQRRVRVFAVEKNPNAVVTLQQQKIELWGDQVSNIWKTFGFLVHLQYKYILVLYGMYPLY